MYSTLIVDFSRVLIFSREEVESLNEHHKYLSQHIESYQVLDHFYLNEALLALLDEVKTSMHLCLFSDSSLHGLPEIRSRIKHTFGQVISADKSGFNKSSPKAYEWLLDQLNARPDKTVFLDDKAANVDAAQAVGIRALQFVDNIRTLPELRTLLQISRAK
jgi:HAD superfamily hydrolase (TIGR01509 family)